VQARVGVAQDLQRGHGSDRRRAPAS
jgi:hypothetical protein